MRHSFRFSGTGGQGLITAGIILAEAALLDDKLAVQSQSYGPEARLCQIEQIEARFNSVVRSGGCFGMNRGHRGILATGHAVNAVVENNQS